MSIISKIEKNSSIKVPEEIMINAGLKPGDTIIWYYDKVNEQVILSIRPADFAKELRGLGKETWQGVEASEYVQEERDSWS
ncbi:MAG: hypothetical protein QM401_06780 [Bacillota bacterium]|nr:hypothetical protein [Bacillota bacterium]